MIKNYFKIAWRNILKNKLFSFINIFGLAIGIACCALIYLYVDYELSYDAYNENADRIVRITTLGYSPKKVDHFAPTSPLMALRMKANFPEVEKIVRINSSKRSISYKDKKFYDTKILYADSALLEVFTFDLIEGDAHKALTKPYSIVLTESTAKKYFGNENAFGKMMQFSDSLNLMVTGIIKDIPVNSHFNTECFISRSTMFDMNKDNEDWRSNDEQNWFNCDSYSYLLLRKGIDHKKLQPKINAMMEKEMADIRKQVGMYLNVELQPLKDIHLRSHLEAEFNDTKNGDILYVYIFTGAAILILLIACCNFINLSTARSLNRSKEIGLRKVIGANRWQLIMQFLGESMIFALIGTVISIIILILFIPAFNSFVGTNISFSLHIIWLYLGIIVSVGIIAGLYPALLMSSFRPIQSLQGKVSHGLSDLVFRKGLVIFQYTIAIILIICTSLILQQLDFIQNRNIGMRKDQVVTLEIKGADSHKSDMILKELMRNPKVVNGTLNSFSFKGVSNITLLPEGASENELTSSHVISVDENFIPTYDIKFVTGRNFSKEFATDEKEAFIVNEAAVKAWGWKTPKEAIGKKVQWAFGKEGKVIGVVKDFNFASLHENVKPLLIHIFPQWFRAVSLRLNTQDLSKTMGEIESTWKGITTESPFKYTFDEDDFNSLYQSEQNMRTVMSAFTFLSVLVACLGLFGLASFTVKQRFKEIGIRKVLGSSISGIVSLLSKDFLKLVLIAFIIAAPVAWYFMNKWLQDYAYRIDISWWIFMVAGVLAIAIAFATVCSQALRAATANPVKSLRTE